MTPKYLFLQRVDGEKVMNQNHKRALKWTVGALIVCLIPLFGRIWLDRNGALERPDLGYVGDFVLRDQADVPLAKDQLRRSITVILHWPAECADQNACENARKTAFLLRQWVDSQLKPKWTEENNPLVLVVVGDGAAGLPEFKDWRIFAVKPDEATLLPAGTDMTKPWLVVADNALLFAAREDLNQSVDFPMLERILSKTAFDQYLGNYLSRRTFMGPKRHQN